jgi:hypothetical protein
MTMIPDDPIPAESASAYAEFSAGSSQDLCLFLSPNWNEARIFLESQGAGVSFGLGRQIRIAWRGRRASLQIRADGRMATAESGALLDLINGDLPSRGKIDLRSDYPARVTFDPHLDLFVAQALGIGDLVMAAGRSKTQVACAYEIAIMDYLAFCKARGEAPEPCRVKACDDKRPADALDRRAVPLLAK